VCNFQFLYTDEFSHEPSVTVALDVLQLARIYQVPALISTCAKLIKERIAVGTCVEIYQRTVTYNDMTLSKDSHEFLTGWVLNETVIWMDPSEP
jgi:hypothetical protein